ncbi:MAG: ribosomal protein S18-alanine N-acetyltransferase [Gammaproteobacteria bacterium]|nr:ribosomal protein S18-alanine N-acetyltransferase [Gammaproteobacteria bacterium]
MSSWRDPTASVARDAPGHFRLRLMCLGDLADVMRVERAAYPFPWTEGIFRDCLRVGYVCKLLEGETGAVGHGIMSIAAGECHILNLCVHPDYQRRGLGRRMLSHLLDMARARSARSALLEVRCSNQAAFALYDQLGFNQIAVRKDYYPGHGGRREDALVLAREL